jgi:hypothetical protein
MIIKYLIVRDGREYMMDAVPDWADSEDYQITKLSSEVVQDETLPSTDDTQERIQLMDELFQLQDKEIALLKQRLEAFVEVVEGIVELTDVVSHSSVECRSKLIIIGDSCKKILAPQE